MRVLACIAVSLAALTSPLAAQDERRNQPEPDSVVYELEPLVVEGRSDDLVGIVESASIGYVGAADLRRRPLTRAGELLETVPGMILTQHSGGGKSNQMFVRGFNLDHGTDFSTRVEGMPVNIPTHAHGQGYTDLNFIIPELVDHIEYSLGSYYADIGDFSSAGGARIRLVDDLERPFFSLGLGEDAFQRVVAAAPVRLGARGSLIVGGELQGFDGPWEKPEDLRKLSGMARYKWKGDRSDVSVMALAYDNQWEASDQIPLRAVQSGLLSRFGQVDPTLGGESARYSLSGSWSRRGTSSAHTIDAYAIHQDLDLFSNFTYQLDDPDRGDQFRQRDRGRWTVGLNTDWIRPLGALGVGHTLRLGTQLRSDWADVALSRTRAREPVGLVRADEIWQGNVGVYTEIKSYWSSVVRTIVGLRGDAYRFDVDADLAANSGVRGATLASPSASLIVSPTPAAELYASFGYGFHSNDARGTVQRIDPESGEAVDPVDPLVRSRGAEVGLRATPVSGLRSTLALWGVDLDSELLFVGDAGRTEPSDPSRRVGVTLANFYRIDRRWSADLDVSLTRARFRDVPEGLQRIPNALKNVVAAGLSYDAQENGPFGAIRLRRFGAYPLVEDDSRRAEASALLNVRLGYRIGNARISLNVLNALDEEHSDIQYFYSSRLAGEPVGGVGDVHFHPAEPRQLRVTLEWGL
ncbi:MAG: TonB-dependent receptor [Gemmatimonadetes bacterium]|nr:TonB-dependent receptor [Gemmatimonadota bacterium]